MVTVFWKSHKIGELKSRETSSYALNGGMLNVPDNRGYNSRAFCMVRSVEIAEAVPITVIVDLDIKFDPDFASLFGITKDSDIGPYGD